MSVIHRSRAIRDRYAALLRDSLRAISPETVSNWITQLEQDLHNMDTETEDRLQCNAMLVGVLTVMLEGIDAESEPNLPRISVEDAWTGLEMKQRNRGEQFTEREREVAISPTSPSVRIPSYEYTVKRDGGEFVVMRGSEKMVWSNVERDAREVCDLANHAAPPRDTTGEVMRELVEAAQPFAPSEESDIKWSATRTRLAAALTRARSLESKQ